MNSNNINQRMIRTACGCCNLLLQLRGKNIHTPTDEKLNDLSLDKIINHLGKKNNTRFKLSNCSLNKISARHVPLGYKNNSGDYVLLARISDDQALIQHPLNSLPEVISAETLRLQWSGEIIEIKDRSSRFDISWFIPAFLKHKKLLIETVLYSGVLQLLALISPLFFQVIMDKVLVHGSLSTLDVLVWVLVMVGIFEVVLKGMREYIFSHTANRIDIILGSQLFTHVLKLSLGWFKNRQVGNIISRIQELNTIRDFLTGSLLTLCVDMVFTVVFLAVMANMSLLLTTIVISILPVYLVLAWRSYQPLQQSIEHQFQSSALNTSFLNESVGGIETIKSLAIEPGMQRRWEQQTADMVVSGFHTQTVNNLISQLVTLLQKITSVAIIWGGAYLVTSQRMSIGQLIAFNMLLTQVHQPFSRLIELWQKFIQTRIAVEKLGDILNQPTEQARDAITPSVPLKGNIILSRVSFRYRPDLPLVLTDISLTIRAGESIGIVGPSGSGKSTLARLLQKLYVPDNGYLQVDDYPFNQLNTGYLRAQTGVVLQENYLFNLSVRQNIAIAEPTVSLDRVINAAKTAGAHEFILQLPLGYDTVLAEAGRSLSGGQRQRIAIARALLSDPRILIFDEATSALDDESQAIIQANMQKISHGRTVIMIAHRLSTVRHCDRIITVEKGLVTESGTHSELLRQAGCYARLWQLQQNLAKEPA